MAEQPGSWAVGWSVAIAVGRLGGRRHDEKYKINFLQWWQNQAAHVVQVGGFTLL